VGRPVAELARVLLMTPALSFEARAEPLSAIGVQALRGELGEGAMLVFEMPRNGGRALLGVKSREEFLAFAEAALTEAKRQDKRFYRGEFALQVEVPVGPTGTLTVGPIRGKRMVSFVKDGKRIFHAWCEGGILHTVWEPRELAEALAGAVEALERLPLAAAEPVPAEDG